MNRNRHAAIIAIIALMTAATIGASGAEEDDTSRMCRLGRMLAFQGNLSAAESVFVSVLAERPDDSRILSNLGNVHLLRGNAESALALYDEALRHAQGDPGIHFNRFLALHLMGLDEKAQSDLDSPGIPDVRAFGNQLYNQGRAAGADSLSRGAGPSYLSRADILALLNQTRREVPRADAALVDTTGVDSLAVALKPIVPSPKDPPPLRRTRTGGPRADELTDTGMLLYWKH